MNPRFFVETIEDNALSREQTHHIRRVLRLRVGEYITLCNGKGDQAQAEITAVGDSAVALRVGKIERNEAEPSLAVTLYIALAKGERIDYAVQKSVELGAAAIVPFVSARCIGVGGGKPARWRRIAESAAAQAGRGVVPPVQEPVSFDRAIALAATAPLSFFCYELPTGLPLRQALPHNIPESAAIVTGPEGGFAPEEAALAAAKLQTVTLGRRILRCETAPVAALAALMFWSGNL